MRSDVLFGVGGELHPKTMLNLAYEAEVNPEKLVYHKQCGFTIICVYDGFSSHAFCVYDTTMECSKIHFMRRSSMSRILNITDEINGFMREVMSNSHNRGGRVSNENL